MKKKSKVIIAAVMLVTMIPLFIIPSSANSAAPWWEGRDSSGVIVKDGDIPIVVESERLIFNINELPYSDYRSGEEFLKYSSTVTAEYTFYNPTDMEITATLLFPFGERPSYAHLKGKNGENLALEEQKKYDITINGQPIEKTVRHTLNNYYDYGERFNTELELTRLSEEYLTDDFYHPELTVTKYTYTVDEIDNSYIKNLSKGKGRKIEVFLNYSEFSDTMRIRENDICYARYEKNECAVISRIEENGTSFSFYIFGTPFSEEPEISVIYSEGYGQDKEQKIQANVTYQKESMTLEELAFSNYDEQNGVSKVDWYNALITELNRDNSTSIYGWENGYKNLMRWYEYEITLAPGERIVNTVTAPVYPIIDGFKNPRQYEYNYLLSPASSWADFGNLEIIINTTCEMSESNLTGFEKTETGYRLVRNGLPTDEEGYLDLSFRLLNDGTPLEQPNPSKVGAFFENIARFLVTGIIYIIIVVESIITSIVGIFK